jgi:hypothetical protein
MERFKKTDSGRAAVSPWKLLFLCCALQGIICTSPARSGMEAGEQGRFIVTGHIYDYKVETGVIKGFLEKAVPFINSMQPDFMVLTGDVVLGCIDGWQRLPVETIRKQYGYVVDRVIGTIETKVYFVAGNHDTGSVPHAPSIELFQTLLNPLRFSFQHKGSLFLFLSIYEPFDHVPQSNHIAPFEAIWEDYDTAASRAFLDALRHELNGSYDHLFVFTHASPCSDTPIGYYWTRFLIPLFSSTGKDVHIFSTDHFARSPLVRNPYRVVRHENVRFYNFAVFPRCTYLVHFDDSMVGVYVREGVDFIPAVIQEIGYQAASRWSMLRRYLAIQPRRYLLFEIVVPIVEQYNRVMSRLRNEGT